MDHGVSGSWRGNHGIAPAFIAPIRRDFLALAVLRKRPISQQVSGSGFAGLLPLQKGIALPIRLAIHFSNADRLRQSLDRRSGHCRPSRGAQESWVRADLS